MKNHAERLLCVHEVRLRCLIDLGLNFSGMLRLYKARSKQKLYAKLLSEIPSVLGAEGEKQFQMRHLSICEWGEKNLPTNGDPGYASYGQVAKTLDVVLKVVIDYGHMPDCIRAKQLSPWLNSAIDNKMMKMLKREYPGAIARWPTSIRRVTKDKYLAIQSLVRRFNLEKHDNQITPVQFDDLYWWCLNKCRQYKDGFCILPGAGCRVTAMDPEQQSERCR